MIARALLVGVVLSVPIVAQSCFRESAPCDQSGFDAVAESCVRDKIDADACSDRLNRHEAFCAKKIRAE